MKRPPNQFQRGTGRGTHRALRVTALLLGAVLAASTVRGQVTISPLSNASPSNDAERRWPPRDRYKGVALLLTAQREGRPALQYQLLPPMEDTQKGNPAVKYLEASSEMPQLKPEQADLLDAALSNAPLAELNQDEPAIKELIDPYRVSLRRLEEGARLDGQPDWEYEVRTQGFKAMLPSLGKFRQIANVLTLQIRLDIKRHDWAAARDNLQSGFALARDMGRGDTLIESLVGVAIAARLCNSLEDWVAEPGSPNLYWAPSNLPTPFADMQRGLNFERAVAYFSFPEMKEFKAGHYSAAGWKDLIAQMKDVSGLVSARPSDPEMAFGGTALGMLMYPQAKAFLVARGAAPAEVEKMPVYEALERYFQQSWDEESDDTYKWNGLSAKTASAGMSAADVTREKMSRNGEGNIFANMLLPSLGKARLLGARVDRQIAVLRIVEAIRAYAADKGTLPENLAALNLPVPTDPMREAPFGYEVTGGKAVLSSPAAVPYEGLRYELTLRK